MPDKYNEFHLHDPAGPIRNDTRKPEVLQDATALGEGDGRVLYAVTQQGTLHRTEATAP